ncbi:MAG: hypothetical protein U9Q76_04915 [candidate division WOR-3 bacterium]|nr:hypothetical protein [candidate division WOR-3 bacterium]
MSEKKQLNYRYVYPKYIGHAPKLEGYPNLFGYKELGETAQRKEKV